MRHVWWCEDRQLQAIGGSAHEGRVRTQHGHVMTAHLWSIECARAYTCMPHLDDNTLEQVVFICTTCSRCNDVVGRRRTRTQKSAMRLHAGAASNQCRRGAGAHTR
jgi:hypothetical protein